MVIQLDRCYKITFKNSEEGAGANFSLLDGFYEVVRSYGWNELMGARIDLQENLLDHAGITDTTLIRTLQTNWVNDAFYYCIGMDRDRQIWVPESIIKGYPEPRIGSYKKLGLVLDLGVFANSEDFSTLGKDIMKYLKSNYGIDRPDATVTVYGNQWMTVEDYENTDLRRKVIQGLAYTNQSVLVRPSNDFVVTRVAFETPVIIAKENEEIQPGAISESINVTYGIDMATIPESADDTINRWFFVDDPEEGADDDVLEENTAIETTLNENFTAKVLSHIRLSTRLKKESYAWVDSNGNHVYTKQIEPTSGTAVYIDSTCMNTIDQGVGTYNGPTSSEEATIIVGSGVNAKTYTFDKDVNYIKVDIGYRCRNTKVGIESPYSQAIKYAYENMALRQKIAALEEYIATQAESNN